MRQTTHTRSIEPVSGIQQAYGLYTRKTCSKMGRNGQHDGRILIAAQ